MTRQRILERAIEAYGRQAQVDMCIEECSELIKALLKARRAGAHADTSAIREEIADVQIMLDQMRLIYGDNAVWERRKLDRLAGRLGAKRVVAE